MITYTPNPLPELEANENGNLKTSIEELDSGISTNNNTQLNVSPYIVDEFGNYSHQLGDSIFRGAPVVVDSAHHEIHCGDSYETTFIGNIGNGGTQDVLIIVPNETPAYPSQLQKLYHFLYEVGVEAECDITFYEGATVSANGTPIPSYNRNRNSTLTDTLGIYDTPTVTTTGTQIEVHKAGSGKSVGGTVNRGQEWVLKNDTIYLLRIVNQTTSSTYVDFNANYYVHPGV